MRIISTEDLRGKLLRAIGCAVLAQATLRINVVDLVDVATLGNADVGVTVEIVNGDAAAVGPHSLRRWPFAVDSVSAALAGCRKDTSERRHAFREFGT